MDRSPAAAAAAARASVAVVFAGDFNAEAFDRPSLSLPGDTDALISAVASANPDTVVVLNTGGPVLMPWLGQVRGVIEAWYPGEEDGDSPSPPSSTAGSTPPAGFRSPFRPPLRVPPSTPRPSGPAST